MFVIIGTVIVFASVIGGFLLEKGNLHTLYQPVELLIIGGAAAGAFLIGSPMHVLNGTIKALIGLLTGKDDNKETYLEILRMLFDLLSLARREGMLALEPHIDKPESSSVFAKYPLFLKNHHLSDFVCDNLKVLLASGIEPMLLDTMMELDIDTQHHEEMQIPTALNNTADSLPGLGIVAAVLGVVLTMGKMTEPPEVLGQSIGAALVGTFLGVLLCYGIVGPLARRIDGKVQGAHAQLQVVKATLGTYAMGMVPILAVEAGRRAIPTVCRPSFSELEESLKRGKG